MSAKKITPDNDLLNPSRLINGTGSERRTLRRGTNFEKQEIRNGIAPKSPFEGDLGGHSFSYKKYINVFYYILFYLLFFAFPLKAQSYTMEQVIKYAQENSPEALKIQTSKENEYWQWRTYKSEYKPQLLVNATMPAYQKNSVAVTQDDGSVVYRTTNQSIAYSALSLEQNIGLTGGKIFLSTDLSRLDDFNQNTNSYSGSPFYIGIEQPLFAFNELKWMNRIEPLKYQESLKEYIEGNENIAYNTVVRYFNLLISQISYQIASTNKANADTIYKIGQERYSIGRISKNELLQLKFGVISSQKSMANAELSIKTSMWELGSYTGLNITGDQQLSLPDEVYAFKIDGKIAVLKALENSNRSIEFKRNILEARRDAEQAKRESRFQASLSLSYGQTNIAPHITGIYDDPQALQTLNVGLSVPILNWGRSKAKREKAMANLKLVEYTMQQTEINYKQEVLTEIENFNMLQEFINYTAEADKTAEERYQIAMLRYMANDISLTEYNIALEQKDQAKKEFITALRDYWLAYYFIRLLTLYDFQNNVSLTN